MKKVVTSADEAIRDIDDGASIMIAASVCVAFQRTLSAH